MKPKMQIINDVNQLFSLIQRNKNYLAERQILSTKNSFYTIVDDLTSQFTEQELYKIQNDLLFYYQSLKEIIDDINHRCENGNIPFFIDIPPYNSFNPVNNFSPSPITAYDVSRSVIPQEDIENYKTYLQRRIEGIVEEIKKVQEMQLRQVIQIYDCYKRSADNLFQEMLTWDEMLSQRQTQQHDADIKNIIAVLDEV